MDQTCSTHGAQGKMEKERVEPCLALDDWVNHNEGDGVAEEDWTFYYREGHIEAYQRQETDWYEVCILLFEEVEKFVKENAWVAALVRIDKLGE